MWQARLFRDRVKVIGDASARRTNAGFLIRLGKTGRVPIARRYGIDRRVLRRWKQELAVMTGLTFVAVQITDAETAS